MAQQGKKFPEPGFIVFGVEDATGSSPDAGEGSKVPFHESLVDDWPNGQTEVGSARGEYTVKQNDDAEYEVTLTSNDTEKSTVTAAGTLKRDKGKFGKGKLKIKGGTGKGRQLRGNLDVQVMNPKRYSHEG